MSSPTVQLWPSTDMQRESGSGGAVVVVTGAAGFLGSHTCIELLQAGHHVIGIDNFDNSSPLALDAVQRVSNRKLSFIEGDVGNPEVLDRAFGNRRVDSIVHFAGLKAVGDSVLQPMLYYRTNIGTSIALIEAMERHDVRRLVFSSSCTVYGEPKSVPITEDSVLQAQNPYGRTKLFVEEMLRDACVAHSDWQVTLLRYFNPVGAHPSGELGEDPSGTPTNLLPYVMQTAVGRRDFVEVFGGDYPTHDGTCVRDYIHVMDLAKGHLAALHDTASGCTAYNLGTGKATTVLEMLAAASRSVGRDIPYRVVGRRTGDAISVFADPSRAMRVLGWRAIRTIDDMCADHWRWQSRHPWGFRADLGHGISPSRSIHPRIRAEARST